MNSMNSSRVAKITATAPLRFILKTNMFLRSRQTDSKWLVRDILLMSSTITYTDEFRVRDNIKKDPKEVERESLE